MSKNNEKTYNLYFKWTISKGRNTYGYNICTLLVDGEKKDNATAVDTI